MRYIESSGFGPYYNLALEEHLMFRCEPGERILYLWQNDRTVVIGRNQEPRRECPVELLEREGVKLARRNSGGGAVYHDLGNLNYTFLFRDGDRAADRQTGTVLNALRSLGFDAEFSGRNDVLVNGSAFFRSGDFCCHHGTLMVDVDLEAAGRYLTPGQDKLSSKGVVSVRSRVVNLRALDPNISVDRMKEALRAAFQRAFGGLEPLRLTDADRADIQRRREKFAGRWIFGEDRKARYEFSRRFRWGGVTLQLDTGGGMISKVRVLSDAMEPELPTALERALTGVQLKNAALSDAVRNMDGEKQMFAEIADWLMEEHFGG